MATIAEVLTAAVQQHQAGNLQQAEQLYRQVLAVDPYQIDALHLLGLVAQQVGRNDLAVEYLGQALRLRPDFAAAQNNLGYVLQQQGRLGEAEARLREALRLKPDYAEAHSNLGNVLRAQGRLGEAEACLREALRLKADYAEAHNNLGVTLSEQGKLAAAVASFQQAVRLKPDYAVAHSNLGNALREQGRLDEAVARLQEALRLKPDYAEAHKNLGLSWLLLGNLEQGWPEYEWRWQCKEFPPPPYPPPRWDGAPLHGRTILLHAEQGLGDSIQFIRYAPLVKQRGGRVLVACPRVLARLLETCPGVDCVLGEGQTLPPFDVHAPLLSLPALFGTSLATVPAAVPYLAADAGLVEQWRRELSAVPAFKVGIAWQGNPKHKDDRYRSLPLARFAPLAGLTGVRLFSLQKGPGAEQLTAGAAPFPVTDLGSWLDDWMDTAAVLKNLDLVISCDTAVAHLAGALGVPVWVLLPFVPDWRWLLGRADSPWYPSLRLFRQPEPGHWDAVFRCLTDALKQRLATPCQARPITVEVVPGKPLDRPGLGADSPEVHNNRGIALASQGRLEAAVVSFQQAVRLRPDYAEAHNNLGIALRAQGKTEEAVASLQEAVRLKPSYAEAHNNLGIALATQGKLEAAVASFQQAVRLKPHYAEAHNNLGNALRAQGWLDEAAASLQQALRLRPNYAEAHNNLGTVLQAQGRLTEAEASLQQAVRLKPNYAEAHMNLGGICKDQGRLDEAIAAYRTALQLKPDAADTHSNLILALHYHPASDARAIFEECRHWNQQHAEPLNKAIRPHCNLPNPERRLRLGYVSPDFRDHVNSFFTVPLLASHDPRQVEIFCYADVARPDALTERFRGLADVWRSTVGLADEQLADLVRRDQIDILVDLAMHTANNRLLVFARKPAPVQVAWLAYPGTTGLATMDYRLTDPYLDPPGLFDAFYAEESLRLPETFWCYDPLTEQPPVNALPAMANGSITFGCLNSFCKINDGVLALWAKVLQAVPQSRLLLLAPRGQAREQVLARLEQEGIAASRVEFADKQPRQEYLALYQRMDVGLDPVPYNGHTTSLDAFWMGVPTLTLVSQKTAFGRAGWSQLCNLGLKELAAETAEQYLARAAQLAGDLPRLQALRGTLRQRLRQSPLMDSSRFARHVEQAYRQMWRRWCQGLQPQRT